MSLKDVAARAGVSFQTASKVLNGQRGVVAEGTQVRILAAARELGYVPNAVARSLVTRTTYAIGILASDLADWVLAQFVVGAEREARRRGHALLIGTVPDSTGDGSDLARQVRLLMERRVDGIITAAPGLEHDRTVAELLRGPIPAVSMHHVPGGGVSLVGSDHAETGRLATEYLLAHGHIRIGTVTGPHRRRVVASRLRGYREALTAAGVTYDDSLVEEAAWTAQSGFTAACRLLDRSPDVTAMVVHSDLLAVGVLSALERRGRQVPRDCSVVGCDDMPLSAHLKPPLTSVHVPCHETGETAVALLIDRIRNGSETVARTLLPVRLVERESVAAPHPCTHVHVAKRAVKHTAPASHTVHAATPDGAEPAGTPDRAAMRTAARSYVAAKKENA